MDGPSCVNNDDGPSCANDEDSQLWDNEGSPMERWRGERTYATLAARSALGIGP